MLGTEADIDHTSQSDAQGEKGERLLDKSSIAAIIFAGFPLACVSGYVCVHNRSSIYLLLLDAEADEKCDEKREKLRRGQNSWIFVYLSLLSFGFAFGAGCGFLVFRGYAWLVGRGSWQRLFLVGITKRKYGLRAASLRGWQKLREFSFDRGGGFPSFFCGASIRSAVC